MDDVEHLFLKTTLLNKHVEEITAPNILILGTFFDRKGNRLEGSEWKVLLKYEEYCEVKWIYEKPYIILSHWVGLQNHMFETLLIKKGDVLHATITQTEEDCERMYEKFCFMADQKMFKNLEKAKRREDV